jgi:small subunit ribosomal protein S21
MLNVECDSDTQAGALFMKDPCTAPYWSLHQLVSLLLVICTIPIRRMNRLLISSTVGFLTVFPFSFLRFWILERPATSLAVNIKVVVGDGEPIESALRRFKREINKSGHLMDLRHRRYFENSQEKKKRKVKEGRLRRKFERMQRRRMVNRV